MIIFTASLLALALAVDEKLVDKEPISVGVGIREFSTFTVADDSASITLSLARKTAAKPEIWADKETTISVEIHISQDGGKTFRLWCGFTADGGELLREDRTELVETSINCPLPRRASRQIKTLMTVKGRALDSEMTLESGK